MASSAAVAVARKKDLARDEAARTKASADAALLEDLQKQLSDCRRQRDDARAELQSHVADLVNAKLSLVEHETELERMQHSSRARRAPSTDAPPEPPVPTPKKKASRFGR